MISFPNLKAVSTMKYTNKVNPAILVPYKINNPIRTYNKPNP